MEPPCKGKVLHQQIVLKILNIHREATTTLSVGAWASLSSEIKHADHHVCACSCMLLQIQDSAFSSASVKCSCNYMLNASCSIAPMLASCPPACVSIMLACWLVRGIF